MGLPLDYQQALREAGPGTTVALFINRRTALLTVVNPEEVQDLRSTVPIALRVKLHTSGEGAAVRLVASFFVDPPLSIESFLNPGRAADRALLESLAQQETVEFYFYDPNDFSAPLLSERIRWSKEHRRDAVAILAQIGPLAQQSVEAFLSAKDSVMRDHPLTSPEELVGETISQWRPSSFLQEPGTTGQAPTKYLWGLQPDGPMIALITPLSSPEALQVDTVAEAQWFHLRRDMAELPGGTAKWKGIVAVLPPFDADGNSEANITLAWPRDWNPIEALRAIVEQATQEEELIPWPIIGGLYAALQARAAGRPVAQWQHVCGGLLWSIVERPFSEVELAPFLPRKEIQDAVMRWGQAPQGWLPANAYSRAQFLWELGRQAWSTDVRVEVAAQPGGVAVTMLMAFAYLCTQPRPLQVGSSELGALRAEDDAVDTVMRLWHNFQFLSTMASGGQITQEACSFILPGQLVRSAGVFPIEPTMESRMGEKDPPKELPDPDYLQAWATEIEREAAELQAKEQRVYVPLGGFIVPVPQETLLCDWGVRELRLYADTGGLWAGIVAPDKRVVTFFRWQQPEARTMPLEHLMYLVPSWAQPSLNLFCAALWRDLRSVGEAGFPRHGTRSRGAPRKTTPVKGAGPTGGHAGPSVRVLPRRRSRPSEMKWRLQRERRVWGTTEEQRIIRRRASITAGHFRAWLYVDEIKASSLLAAAAEPPMDVWRERLRQARRRGDEEKGLFWEALLQAAGTSRQKTREIDRLLVVESVLAGVQRKHVDKPRLLQWIGAALGVIEEAKQCGIGDMLDLCQESLQRRRGQAAARAARWGAPAPPAGFTFVQPFTSGGRGEQDAGAPIVRAKGLLVVQTVLQSSATAGAGRSVPEEGEG